MKPAPMLEIFPLATLACRQINAQIEEEMIPNTLKNRKEFRNVIAQTESEQETCHIQTQSESKYQKIVEIISTKATMTDDQMYEYSEIGWEGPTDELAMFILIGGCQCVAESECLPMLDPVVNKIGISFRSHKKFKSVLQILYLKQ